MSSDQMTRGLEVIASAAEKVDLHLGSRAVDLFRGIVRVSRLHLAIAWLMASPGLHLSLLVLNEDF